MIYSTIPLTARALRSCSNLDHNLFMLWPLNVMYQRCSTLLQSVLNTHISCFSPDILLVLWWKAIAMTDNMVWEFQLILMFQTFNYFRKIRNSSWKTFSLTCLYWYTIPLCTCCRMDSWRLGKSSFRRCCCVSVSQWQYQGVCECSRIASAERNYCPGNCWKKW